MCIFKVHNVSQWPNLRHLCVVVGIASLSGAASMGEGGRGQMPRRYEEFFQDVTILYHISYVDGVTKIIW